MTRYIIFSQSLCFFCLLALPAMGFACRCPEPISPTAAYQRALVVLVGKVIMVNGDLYAEGATARVSVLKAWKKALDREVEIFTHTTCAFEFKIGEEYLLYLEAASKDNHYVTKKCIGNLPVAQADEALAWLNSKGKLASEFKDP